MDNRRITERTFVKKSFVFMTHLGDLLILRFQNFENQVLYSRNLSNGKFMKNSKYGFHVNWFQEIENLHSRSHINVKINVNNRHSPEIMCHTNCPLQSNGSYVWMNWNSQIKKFNSKVKYFQLNFCQNALKIANWNNSNWRKYFS